MDQHRLDALARAVSDAKTRRQALGLLAAVAFAGLRSRDGYAAQDDMTQSECEPGLTFCESASACVDLASDLNNCGACGSVCESGLVAVACRNGECVRADCPPEQTYCGAVDLCRDLANDPLHCGACQNPCASGVCSGGNCAAAGGAGCAPGQADCGGVCVDTCCDNNNCGACGNACTGGLTCFEGVCDCPRGDCGPTDLPSTGSGAAAGSTRLNGWTPVALAGTAVLIAGIARRLVGRPDAS